MDLFAGCGGFSQGLRTAGLSGVAKVEFDESACETLRTNFPDAEIITGDIRGIDDQDIRQFSGVDLIVGGPPCQGFSVAGSTQYGLEDPRNDLFVCFLHWVLLACPLIAMMENVPGILRKKNSRGQTVLEYMRETLSPAGYEIDHRILNAADFGTPQLRRRAFIVATQPGVRFEWPESTHSDSAAVTQSQLFSTGVAPYVTVGQALSDLPRLSAGEGAEYGLEYHGSPENDFQAAMRSRSYSVTNHVAMKHTQRLVERFRLIRPGQSLKDVPLTHGQIAKRTGEVSKKPFKYNNYRLDPNSPSLAIPASFQSLFLHPGDDRNLTAREAARLMSFPDDFMFKGKRTTMSWEKSLSQYNQIGNAVCPRLSQALGEAVIAALGSSPGSSVPVSSRVRVGVKAEPRPPAPAPAPDLAPLSKETEVYRELTRISRQIANKLPPGDDSLRVEGLTIPIAALGIGLLVATEADCPVCRRDSPPHGEHQREIPYLISKDGTETLVTRGKDHGLDYHLRAMLGIDHQCGHFVGEAIAEAGLGKDVMMVNLRTGRRVRGVSGVSCPPQLDRIRSEVFTALGSGATAG